MALLIGDSIFARLYESHPSSFDPLSKHCCVRGGKVQDVKMVLKSISPSVYPCSAVLLLGINDFLHVHEFKDVWSSFASLVRYLTRHFNKIFVCELLPVANSQKAKLSPELARFNFHIRNLRFKPKVTIISFESIFRSNNAFCLDMYCPRINSRPDYIHPSSKGLALMRSQLLSALCV